MCRRECLSGDKCEHIRYCKSSAVKAQAHYREWQKEAGRDAKGIPRGAYHGHHASGVSA